MKWGHPHEMGRAAGPQGPRAPTWTAENFLILTSYFLKSSESIFTYPTTCALKFCVYLAQGYRILIISRYVNMDLKLSWGGGGENEIFHFLVAGGWGVTPPH